MFAVGRLKGDWVSSLSSCGILLHWVSTNKLKRLSFWGITKPHNCSWSWRNLLKIRDQIIGFFDYKLGKGSRFSFWYDPWLNGRSVTETFPEVKILDADIPKQAVVSDVWKDNNWMLPDPIDESTYAAWDHIKSNYRVNLEIEDVIRWKNQKNGSFTIKSLWNSLNPTNSRVSWHSLVWFPEHIPRHSFITWIALKGRLQTRDKLLRWKIINCNVCPLCNAAAENIPHLFFECSYSKRIWESILVSLNFHRLVLDWRREISFLSRRCKGRSKETKKRKISFCAAVYWIWKARNEAVFNQKIMSTEMVAFRIKEVARARLNL
ncbi:uncharacterized protein LOC126687844 [Mercurialis annua]|uniref:uncharacterized protein LOC126687844 n=1 Tax=Mercurialis annua TaxID=3986 RepID=UPI00215FA936|nr:uncharacterized protein LOC126687844 [Mercurialis annua]